MATGAPTRSTSITAARRSRGPASPGSTITPASYVAPPTTGDALAHHAASRSLTWLVPTAATRAAAAPTPIGPSIIEPTMVPMPAARVRSRSSRATPRPPHLASLTLTRSAARWSMTAARSRRPNTDSSAITGVSTAAVTVARPRTSWRSTGCSTNSTSRPASSIARMTAIAWSGVQPWLASTRIRASGAASRTARTRATSVAASVPTLSLRTVKPSAVRLVAVAASSSGSPAETVTSVGTRWAPVEPPRNAVRLTPARRAARSCSATSIAALAPKLPTTASSSSAPRSERSSTERPRTTSASGPLRHASAPASDSPVTRQTCGASPYPLTPSSSTTSTTVVSRCSVRRNAVTNGVWRGAVSRWQRISVMLIEIRVGPSSPTPGGRLRR